MRPGLLFTFLTLALSPGGAMVQPSSPEFKVGERFPNLVLPSLADGRPLSMAQFRGQKVILQLFASW